MLKAKNGRVDLALAIILAFLLNITLARHPVSQAKGLPDTTPLVRLGWTVPLEGSRLCTNSSYCTDTLSMPPADSILQYLAIGRGTITYSCAGRSAVQKPLYVTQNAFLYDVSPLVPKFSSEDQFHSYIPRFLDYDYTSLNNSTLKCIGNLLRTDGFTIFDIYQVAAFPVKVREVVNSPNEPQFDIQWAHSQDESNNWDIYRVETAGGGPPYNCGDQIISDEIPVEYVAEYWFYHRNSKVEDGDIRK